MAPSALQATTVPAPADGSPRLRRLGHALRETPVTTALVAALFALGAVTGALWHAADGQLLAQWSFGLPPLRTGRVWTLVTGLFMLPQPVFYPLVGGLLAVGLGWYERHAGSARAALAFGITHLAGVLLPAGLLAIAGGAGVHWPWAELLAGQTDAGASAAAFGVIGAASALVGTRRRGALRLLGGGYLVVMLLKSGLLWDAEHLAAFLTGLAIGPRLANRPIRWGSVQVTDSARRAVVAAAVTVIAATNLAESVYPGVGGIFGGGAPHHRPMHHFGLVMLEMVIAILIADGLRRGRAAAWWVAAAGAAGIAANTAFNTWGALRVADLVCCAILLALLVGWRAAWQWRTPDGFARSFLLRVSIASAAMFVASTVFIGAMRTHFSPLPDVSGVVRQALSQFTMIGPALQPADRAGRLLLAALSLGWALTLLALVVRWVYADRGPDAGHKMRMKELIRHHGGGSLGWLRTWPQFATWTTADGSTAIGYCVVGTVAIAIGDPVGAQDGWPKAVQQFRRFCHTAGWSPCWFAASGALAAATDSWKRTQIGDDTQIALPGLEFRGKPWQDVRTARNRAEREAITMRAGRLTELGDDIGAQVRAISRQWVDGKPLPEMGFTLGTVDSAADDEVRTHVAVDAVGVVQGVITWLPVHRGGTVTGWTLDVMRRRTDGFRPAIEFLIAESLLLFRDQGYATVSLSVAPLARRSTPARPQNALDALLQGLSRLLEPTYGFNSLLAFKAKFAPEFRPVYLVYASAADLPAIAVAISRAYLPHLSMRQTAGLMRTLAAGRRARPRVPGQADRREFSEPTPGP